MEENRHLRGLLTGLIFVGALYRYWPYAFPLGPCGIGYESLEIACTLAKKASFADPFAILRTGPSAHLAPLFPWLVSLLIRWLGDGPASINAVQWMGTLAIALQLALWPWVTERLSMGFVAGVIGAFAWLVAGFALLPMWEAVYVGLLILILVICMHRILSGPVSTVFVSLTGTLWGITFLCSPVPLLPYMALTSWIFFFRPIRRFQKLALIVIPFAVISPWLARNVQVFHHFIMIRDNLGMELRNANNDCATFAFENNRAINCYNHPNERMAEAKNVLALGEYEYNREKLREALAWIKGNPGKFASLTKQRFLAFWFYIPDVDYFFTSQGVPAIVWVLWLSAPLSLGGLWLLFKTDRNGAGMCLVWLVLFPPIYYLVAFIPRNGYPILWASFMPASFFLSRVAQGIRCALRKSGARTASVGKLQGS